MHEVLINCLGGLSLPRKSVVRLTARPDMTLDVYRGRKTTIQQLATNLNIETAMSEQKVQAQIIFLLLEAVYSGSVCHSAINL